MARVDQRVIIMEGPDRCGKTNVGQALSEHYSNFTKLNVPYFKVSSEAENWRKPGAFQLALEYDQPYIAEFLEQTGHSAIIDRAYPSEWVYSKVFNRDTNASMIDVIDRKFAKLGAIAVILMRRHPPKEWDDELVSRDKFDELSYEYGIWFEESRCSAIKMYVDDYNCDTSEQMPPLSKAIEAVVKCPGVVKVTL